VERWNFDNRRKSTVAYRVYPGVTHDGVLAAAAEDVASWLTGRLGGGEAPSTCDAD
jgi:hypothetical protein